MNSLSAKTELIENGFAILDNIYSENEIVELKNCIEKTNQDNSSFLISKDLFAIRQLLIQIPELKPLLFNKKLIDIISNNFDKDAFLTKAIYFDKPQSSNWFVSYHQDLSISVSERKEVENYKNWTFKKGQHGVQPPVQILENTLTVRIHLDDTNKENGALKVLPNSHLNGVIRNDSEEVKRETKVFCEVSSGGIMLMKPLLFHASERTTNNQRRRVIHLEFNSKQLHPKLNWLEYMPINIPAQNLNQ